MRRLEGLEGAGEVTIANAATWVGIRNLARGLSYGDWESIMRWSLSMVDWEELEERGKDVMVAGYPCRMGADGLEYPIVLFVPTYRPCDEIIGGDGERLEIPLREIWVIAKTVEWVSVSELEAS